MQTQTNKSPINIGTLINQGINQIKIDNNENKKYRKIQKPKFARFKASFKYKNNSSRVTQYSLDWIKVYNETGSTHKDWEISGLETLKLWALKCLRKELLEDVKIFITFRADKKTDVMDYDTEIFFFHYTMSLDKFKTIPQLQFDEKTGKVKLDLLYKVKESQELERERARQQYKY